MQITNLHPGNVRMNDIFSIQKQSHKRCEHIINSGPIAPQSGILQLFKKVFGDVSQRHCGNPLDYNNESFGAVHASNITLGTLKQAIRNPHPRKARLRQRLRSEQSGV